MMSCLFLTFSPFIPLPFFTCDGSAMKGSGEEVVDGKHLINSSVGGTQRPKRWVVHTRAGWYMYAMLPILNTYVTVLRCSRSSTARVKPEQLAPSANAALRELPPPLLLPGGQAPVRRPSEARTCWTRPFRLCSVSKLGCQSCFGLLPPPTFTSYLQHHHHQILSQPIYL